MFIKFTNFNGIVIGLLLLINAQSFAQSIQPVNDIGSEIAAITSLKDTSYLSLFRTMRWVDPNESFNLESKKTNKLFIHPVTIKGTYNSEYPRSFNDGALWSSKGISSWTTLGVSYQSKNLEVTIFPEWTSSQNASYNIASPFFNTDNPFRYPWNSGIDLPQRFGEGSVNEVYLGQSRIKYTWKDKLYVRFSNENMWWGPSYHNPILMSNTAPGIPHLGVGSEKLLITGIGKIGFGIYWGRMKESAYFDDNDVDGKFFSGMTFEYHPSFVDGLSLGFGRLLYRAWDPGEIGAEDFVKFITQYKSSVDSTGGNDEFDQLASLFLKWRFPSVGFEVFFEYARNDFGGDLQNLVIAEPDHSSFYSFGFSKLIDSSLGDLRFLVEFNNLSRSNIRTTPGPSPILYVHNIASGGYTNFGQLVGSSIGPGGNTQIISFDLFRNGKTYYRGKIQRISFNDDFYFDNASSQDLKRDVETSLNLTFYRLYDKYRIGANATLSVRDNWNFIRDNDVTNMFLGLELSRSF